MEDIYYIKISPESLSSDIVQETFSGFTFGVYSGMSEILSGNTGGTSLLTGLTIPIVFTESMNDLGYYSPFDGFMLQKDVVTNFIVSGDPSDIYTIRLYNTSETTKNFLQFSSYIVDWGDGFTEPFTQVFPSYLSRTYPSTTSEYTITLKQTNPWGTTVIEKPVYLPHTGVTITNPQGNITFTSQGGSWSGIPINYDYIYFYDSDNTISGQTSDNFTTVPFPVSGFTFSQLNNLKLYGPTKFSVGVPIFKNNQVYGQIDLITPQYTAYTVNDIQYYDYPDGSTIFIVNSSGITSNDIIATGITKQEVLLDFVMSPEIQSEIFIERGKNSAFEGLQRLGEVDNMGDLNSYGYGFFKFNNT